MVMKYHEKIIVGTHSWRDELKVWETPMAYDEWKAAVCGKFHAPEGALQKFYAAQWDAADCREYMSIENMFGKPPKPKKARVVVLDDVAVNRRYALALWRESMKLLTRKLTPSARQLVGDMWKRMGAQLEIDDESKA